MSSKRAGKKIYIALDGSDGCKYVFDFALEHMYRPGDTLYLLLVHERKAWNLITDLSKKTTEELDKSALEHAQKLLEKYCVILREKKIDSKMFIQTGVDDAKAAICDVTLTQDCDMLIIGGRATALQKAFLGSTSDYCVHHAHCPVVVVYPDYQGSQA